MTIEDEMFELEEFNRRYVRWIVNRMDGRNHLLLFRLLHDVLFTWDPNVPMDENRESDGRRMRYVFEEETGYTVPQVAEEWPASFLEVVVSLAETLEDCIMHAPGSGDDSSRWFWLMLSNIGLSQCDDKWMEENGIAFSKRFIFEKVDDVLLRRYDSSGNGGLFPLHNAKEDQRGVQLWYQMNSYILEQEWV